MKGNRQQGTGNRDDSLYFSSGKGDYTKERHQWRDEKTLADVLMEMKKLEEDNTNQYDEIIE